MFVLDSEHLRLLNGIHPAVGNTFTIFTATSRVSGTFSNLLLPSLGPGLAMHVIYNPTNVTLQIDPQSLLSCDLNGDRSADPPDAGIMFGN